MSEETFARMRSALTDNFEADTFVGSTDDTEQRVERARSLVRGCVPIAGTPAATYLARRGISPNDLPPKVIGWHGKSCAILFVATNEKGAVQAVQRVHLNQDGTKADVEPVKRTNGLLGGAAVILPGEGSRTILCEGPEDALSVWQACNMPVRCVFGVSNLAEAPIPDGHEIILVADNDPPENGSHVTVRKAITRLRERGYRVLITRPPAGMKDANELLIRNGGDAVAAMVASAGEGDVLEENGPEATEDSPKAVHWPPGFTMDEIGLKFEKKVVAGPFEVIGRARDPRGEGWARWLTWRDDDGRIHAEAVADGDLYGDVKPLCARLANKGLRIERSGGKHLADFLNQVKVDSRVTIVNRTGWVEIGGTKVFVLPEEAIGATGQEGIILNGEETSPYEQKNTLDEWKAGVGELVAGHRRPILAVATAFAGPLLRLVEMDGGGINLFGMSSRGKSTCLEAAASVWGKGASPGYVRPWRATANAIEGAASLASDTFLALDELSLVDAKEAASAVYLLAGGTGKGRLKRDASLRPSKTWQVMFLSTGELPMSAKIEEERGGKARAGQQVRLLDIPAYAGRGYGVFDHAGPDNDPGKLSDAIKKAARIAYGTAGPAFVRRLVEIGIDEVASTVREAVDAFIEHNVAANWDGQIKRAAARLAIIGVAGELAREWGIVPWQAGAAMEAAAEALKAWVAERGGVEAAEDRQAVAQVRRFIEQHGDARFENLDLPLDRTVYNRAGWRRGDGDDRQWLVPAETWRSEICVGLDSKAVARTLIRKGMLKRATDGFLSNVKIRATQTRVYVLTAAILDGVGQ